MITFKEVVPIDCEISVEAEFTYTAGAEDFWNGQHWEQGWPAEIEVVGAWYITADDKILGPCPLDAEDVATITQWLAENWDAPDPVADRADYLYESRRDDGY
jgi:hypothetical protein